MAGSALARETIVALRHQIAKIEGRLAERLDAPDDVHDDAFGVSTGVLVRAGAEARVEMPFLATGVDGFDTALGGGLPKAALTEIHAIESRTSGLSAGFMMALATLAAKVRGNDPLLWIGTSEIFREAGFPYATGMAGQFGLPLARMLFAEAPKLADALWIAEEAARLSMVACVILEQRGNPERLDLTATRRLHRRAIASGRPVLLLRQGAAADPTAAPVRLVVSPAPAAPRLTLAGPLAGTIGDPAFLVAIGKSRAAPAGPFVLEWNSHDLAFRERKPAHSRRLVSVPRHGADMATETRAVLAFPPAPGDGPAGAQPAGGKRPADRSARRAG